MRESIAREAAKAKKLAMEALRQTVWRDIAPTFDLLIKGQAFADREEAICTRISRDRGVYADSGWLNRQVRADFTKFNKTSSQVRYVAAAMTGNPYVFPEIEEEEDD